MSRLSRLFFWVSGRKGVWLGAGACSWTFSFGDVIFCFVAVVSLGSRIFAVKFSLNALFLVLGVVFGSGRPNPPFVPAVGLIHSCPANLPPPGPCLQTYCRRRRHRASSEPSVVRRAHCPSRVRHRASESVVAAPAQSWVGF